MGSAHGDVAASGAGTTAKPAQHCCSLGGATGYVIWIYNCVEAVRQPKEPAAKTKKRIEEDPTLCERPKFYLGATKTTPRDRGLWVVEMPRLPNKLEKQRLPKDELKAWPKVPKFKLGDYVIINGDFKLSSPHGERNSDGLLVFESLEAAKPGTPPLAATPPSDPPPPAPTLIKQPARKPVNATQFKASQAAASAGNLALGRGQYADAEKAYREAIAASDDNHLAWYGLGGTYAAQQLWVQAAVPFDRAYAIRPDGAMYAMWSGVTSYEIALKTYARSFKKARFRLERAVELDRSLWRAQLYLGRVYRAADEMRPAAKAFTLAAANSREAAPFIALIELYRRWS